MFEYLDYKDFLNDELLKRTTANRAYSLRAFAKNLNVSSGELSEILNGKRKLSLKSAIKIAKSLGLNSHETKHFIGLVENGHGNKIFETGKDEKKIFEEKKLSIDQFDIVSEWYHFAILNLLECYDFEWSFNYIAKRLGITPFEVKMAIDKMQNVGLIKKIMNKDGTIKYQVTEDYVMSAEGVPSKAIKNYHRQILSKAIESIEIQKVEDREISGIGLAINKNDLKAIKKEISDFQDLLVEKYSKGKKDRVYQLEMAFFALTIED